MKKVRYYKKPIYLKLVLIAIPMYYIVRYYDSIELYKILILLAVIAGFFIIAKVNERYVMWNDEAIYLRVPGSKKKIKIKVENIVKIFIDNKNIKIVTKSEEIIIPLEGLGDLEDDKQRLLIKEDFKSKFSHLI